MTGAQECTISAAQVTGALSTLVGPSACLTSQDDVAPYVTDYRGIYRGRAAAVVLPASTAEVSEVLSWCHERGVAVVPQGGNTSLMGGAVPDESGTAVVLNLRRMNRVLSVDLQNDTLALQAGVTLAQARATAEAVGRLFPLRIGSEGSCQIGGNIATNAGGTAVLRYGNMRDLVLGIEVVLPDGRIYEGLRGLRKDNTGYDLKQLFIGSEGTLGIVTAAVLKLMPRPRASAVALVSVASPLEAVRLLGHARAIAGQDVTAFELISGDAMELVCGYLGGARCPLAGRPSWMVLLELTSTSRQEALDLQLQELLEAAFEEGLVADAAVAASLADAEAFWRLREEISDAQTSTGGSIKCDISVPLSRIGSFVEEASIAVRARVPDVRMIVYGHMGDGNVHFNPLRPASLSAATFLSENYTAISRMADGLASGFGGSISAEHGIGVVKRDDLPLYKSEVELDLMRSVKKALDPRGLLNPGKLLPL